MKKLFNAFVSLRLFGIVVLVGLSFSSTASGVFAAQQHGAGSSYTSPSFGFSVSWDDSIWEGDELSKAEGVELNSDLSYAIIQGIGGYGKDAGTCLDESSASMSSQKNVSDFVKAPRKMSRPETGEDAVGELYTYVEQENGGEIAAYIECRALPVDGSVLQVIVLSYVSRFDDAIGTWEVLLTGIDSGGGSHSNGELSTGKIGKKGTDSGLDGNLYTDVNVGFSVTWNDDEWSVRKTTKEDGLGIGIIAQSENSYGLITGDPFEATLEDCAATYAESVGTIETITKMKEAPASLDIPKSSRDAVGGLYTYTDTSSDPLKMVAYFECRPASEDESLVTVLLSAPKASYTDELPLWEDLLAGIEVDKAAANNSDEDDSDDAANADDEAVVDGVTVAGPRFGFELTYDDSVWSVDDLSDLNNDFFDLKSEVAVGWVAGFNMPYDAETCLQTFAGLKQSDGVTDFRVAPKSMKRPKTDRAADGDLYMYTFEGNNGPVDAMTYVECRPLDDGAATLVVDIDTVPSVYEDALPIFEELLAGVSTGE